MNNKYRNLLKDTILFTVGNIGSKLILFIMVPLYTNFLTEAEYGIADLVFSASQLIVPFVSLVIFESVIRFGLSKEEHTEDVLLIGLGVFLIGSILTVAITPLFGVYKALAEWKWYMCVYIIFNMLASILGCYIKSVGQNKLYAAVNILQTLVMALLNVLLLVIWRTGVRGYLLSTIIASAMASGIFFVCGNLAADLKKAHFHPELLKKMVSFSAPLILNNVSWWAIHSSDKIMIEMMVGSVALGLYTVASKIPALINVIISIFSQAWNIATVKEEEGEGDSGFYSKVFFAYQTVTFGVVIILSGLMKPFMSLYVGSSFVSAWRYVPVLLAAAGFSAISAYFSSLYGALKKSINNMATTLTAATANVLLNYLMIRRLGIWGAPVATLIAYFLLATIRMVDVKRYLKIDISGIRYAMNTALILIQVILVSQDYYGYLCSMIVMILYAVINLPVALNMRPRKWRGTNEPN